VNLRYHVDHIRVATIAGFVEFAQSRRYAKDFCRELSRKIQCATKKKMNTAKVVAEDGDRTIKLSIKFRTDEMDPNQELGEIFPKHAWDAGIVNVVANPSHGIKAELPEQMCFNSLAELPAVIERTLTAMGVTLHHDRKSRKLFASDQPE
jgi:hypothetical protein